MPDYVFRLAKREDLPRLRGLWRTGFGDSDAFIACFEQRMASHPEWMELALWGDEPVAMLTMIPCALHIQGHGVFQSGFYYALTTDPAHRGRGIAPRLMANAAEHRIGRGMDCLLGVPDTGSLFTYYHRVDHHRTAFYTRILLTTREAFGGCPGIPPERVDAEEYRAIREEYLAGRTYLSWDADAVDFQREICRQGGGDLYRFPGKRTGCAAAQYTEDGTLLLNELLAPEEELAACLSGLLERMPAERLEVRMPVWLGASLGGEILPFGDIAPGGPAEQITGTEAYVGLDLA